MTLPPLSHHRFSTCHRHPSKPITGFCAACLRERLAGIDPDTHHETPITNLRRTKSYSSSSNPNASSTSTCTATTTTTASEPRRKSCDVRSRNTLSDLFVVDDKRRSGVNRKSKALDLDIQLKEVDENGAEIRVSEEIIAPNVSASERIVEDFEEDGELKTMKEFIDLEFERKKNGGKDLRGIAGSFWEAASVFSKKFGKWQLKQKMKQESKDGKGGGLTGKSSLRKLRETQSEVGDYVSGRRYCDTDRRLSVDVVQFSVDDSRYSFDEPRASWDGYLIGKTLPQLTPLVSVAEDVKVPSNGVESPKENVNSKNEVENSPGGTLQTRDYYSAGRRRSFDRSNSNRKVSLGDEELKSISNSKVSPETVGLFHGAKLLVTEKELRDSNWYSLKDYHAENVDSLAEDVTSSGVSKKGFHIKKLQRWRAVWNIWGLMQRKSESKCGDGENRISRDVVDESVAESLQKIGGLANGQANGTVSQKLVRSYTVSARDSSKMACSAGNIETKENYAKRREELALQRNRSVRYSPKNLDNGLLRFYLTPLRSYGRSKSGKSRLKNTHSIARNIL